MSARSPLEVRVYRDLDAARAPWEALAIRAPHRVFQTWTWLDAWQRHVGARAGVSPKVLVAFGPDDAPLVVWPVGLRRRGPLRVLGGLGGLLSDYQGPIVAPEVLAEAPQRASARLDQVVRALPEADVTRFERIPAVLGGAAHPLLSQAHRRAPADSHALDLPADWTALYRARCSARTRSTHRRKLKKMAAFGPVGFEVASTPAARERLLERALDLKSQGYHRLGVPDLFAHAGRRAMLAELARSPRSLLHISALTVAGVPRATHVGTVYRGTFNYLLPGFADDPVSALSPGDELCRRLLAWACDRGLRRFDFTLGDEPYKDRWCDQREAQTTVTLPASRRGRVMEWALSAQLEAVRLVKGSEAAYPRALALRAWWSQARRRD